MAVEVRELSVPTCFYCAQHKEQSDLGEGTPSTTN